VKKPATEEPKDPDWDLRLEILKDFADCDFVSKAADHGDTFQVMPTSNLDETERGLIRRTRRQI
jgi:hypothetical protein